MSPERRNYILLLRYKYASIKIKFDRLKDGAPFYGLGERTYIFFPFPQFPACCKKMQFRISDWAIFSSINRIMSNATKIMGNDGVTGGTGFENMENWNTA